MVHLFTKTATLALFALCVVPSQAMETLSDSPTQAANLESSITEGELKPVTSSLLNPKKAIAVARLDGGRLIPTPDSETQDWTFLDRRLDMSLIQLGDATAIKYTPEFPNANKGTDNKIDEIRLAAANEGYDYVLIYGVGPDAGWASFGGQVLQDTGLTITDTSAAWDGARAKALLVNSFTGDVLGAVTANEIDFNIGQLADRVGEMIQNLSTSDITPA